MFARRGAAAVTLGHFLTFLRPVVFLLAGASRMGWPVFMAANVVGAVIWAFVIPKSGEVGGDVIGWIWRRVSGG
jgi:membrane protein DedA with SNARE-associated domain